MATLKQLIEDGLKVGALVEYVINENYYCYETGSELTSVWQWDGNSLNCIFNDGNYFLLGDKISPPYAPSAFQLTTAYDSRIDPETLPIPEPFWTGWFILDRTKREITNILPCPPGFDIYYNNNNSIVYSSICQPCLPPNQ